MATASGVETRLRRVAWMHGFVGVGVGGAGAQAAQVYGRRAEAATAAWMNGRRRRDGSGEWRTTARGSAERGGCGVAVCRQAARGAWQRRRESAAAAARVGMDRGKQRKKETGGGHKTHMTGGPANFLNAGRSDA